MPKKSKLEILFTVMRVSVFSPPSRTKDFQDDGRLSAKSTLNQKLFCWVCGLYQTESDLCLACNYCNKWTLSKIYPETYES